MNKGKAVISLFVICIILITTSSLSFTTANADLGGYWKLDQTKALYDPGDNLTMNYIEFPWGREVTEELNGLANKYTGTEGDIYLEQRIFFDNSINREHYTWTIPPAVIYPKQDFDISYGSAPGGTSRYCGALYYGYGYGKTSMNTIIVGKDQFPVGSNSPGFNERKISFSSYNIDFQYIYKWIENVPTITSFKVTPSAMTLTGSNSVQLKAIAAFSDGTTKDITKDPNTEYDVDDPTVAGISSTGLVKLGTSAQNGEDAVITVLHGDQEATCTVKISMVKVKSLKSTTPSVVLSSTSGKNTKQLKITAILLDNKAEVVTSKVTYTTNSPNYFTVSSTGVLKVSPGTPSGSTGTVTASYGGANCTIKVTVSKK